jgi:hypothetical protein
MDGWGSISESGKSFSLLYSVQTGSEIHSAFYPMDAGSSFFGAKSAEA